MTPLPNRRLLAMLALGFGALLLGRLGPCSPGVSHGLVTAALGPLAVVLVDLVVRARRHGRPRRPQEDDEGPVG